MATEEVAHDETPATRTDHAFEPKDEWWSLCKHCNFAESAHSETAVLHYVGDDITEEE